MGTRIPTLIPSERIMSNQETQAGTNTLNPHADLRGRRSVLATLALAPAALMASGQLSAKESASSGEKRTTPTGKVAIVTGSSRGIGAAMARRLAAEGHSVVVNCVVNVALAEAVVADIVKRGGKAIAVQADVRDAAAVRKLFAECERAFGGVDIVVNNAGIMRLAPFKDMSDEDYAHMMDVNVKGGFQVLREAAAKVRDGGRIISTSSSITQLRTATYGPYAASKAALEVFTNVLAKELAGRKISVNAIAPGVVNTPLFTDGKSPEAIQGFAQRTPHGRLGEPEDIANVVASLCSADSWWVNGQTVFANGGLV